MPEDVLPIALRPWAVPVAWSRGETPETEARPHHLLVFDCETRLSPEQRLTFGSARLYRRGAGRYADVKDEWEWFTEFVFYDEGLQPHERGALDEFMASLEVVDRFDPLWSPAARSFVAEGTPTSINEHGVPIHLVDRAWFVRHVIREYAARAGALVCLFNAPFDISRTAVDVAESRPRRSRRAKFDAYAGGFSFVMEHYRDADGEAHESSHSQRIAVKTIDSKRHLIAFRSSIDRPLGLGFDSGHFVDLHTLAYALTNTNYSLDRACKAFGLTAGKLDWEPSGTVSAAEIAYNRQDVAATFALGVKLLAEYDRHPISLNAAAPSPVTLSETRAYSPASIGKAYLRGMGLRPVLERQPDFPAEVIGYAMTAFYGGRAECRIRRTLMPVVYCDYLSMYQTVNANMGLWRLLIAETISVEDATEDVRQLLAGLTVDDLYDPATWRQFPVLVQCQPMGDILPVRAAYDAEGTSAPRSADWQIGVNHVWAEQPLWYALPDLVGAKVLGGHAPRVVRAMRLIGRGRQHRLRPIRLRGDVEVDPSRSDFFSTVVEERHALATQERDEHERERLDRFLKVFASSTSFGIYAEAVRHELGENERQPVVVHGLHPDPVTVPVQAPETPGEYSFPPVAACITAAARLMLALLERAVTDAGGSYVFTDTDSMTIVATEHGGSVSCRGGSESDGHGDEAINALSWAEVDAIRTRFNRLKPYGPGVRDDLLKLEKQNFSPGTKQRRQLYAYAISAKRYSLGNLGPNGEWVPRRCSEHGLGHLLDPTREPGWNPKSDSTRVAELLLWPDDAELDTQTDGDDGDEDERLGTRPWICAGWTWIVEDALGTPVALPAWAERPAVARISASTPRMLRAFGERRATPYAERIKPFNFLLTAHVDRLWLTHVPAAEPFHLVAPYWKYAADWLERPWFDRYSGREYAVTTSRDAIASVRVKSYGDIFSEHRFRQERKSLGPAGERVERMTAGLLRRRIVRIRDVTYIGKESNRLSDRAAGLVQQSREVLTTYPDPRVDVWGQFVRPRLAGVPTKEIADATGKNRSTVKRWKAGEQRPRARELDVLLRLVHERDEY